MIRFLTCATAIAAALSMSAASAQTPTMGFVDNLDGTVTLQITPDPGFLPAALAAEIAFEGGISSTGNLQIVSAFVASPSIFDTPNPGDSPFIPGSPIGGDANGLNVDTANDQIFAAFGSDVVSSAAPIDFLTIELLGQGTLEAFGVLAQSGAVVRNVTASITIIPEPAAASLAALALCGGLVRRRR